jgi:hypothetical protein
MTLCKKLSLVALCATFSVLTAFAQKAPIKFGKIDEADLKMTVYPKDSSASAVILCDYGDARVEYNKVSEMFEIVYVFHKRVKIFKADPSVLNSFGNIDIPYRKYDSKYQEVVSNLKATVYSLENGSVKESKLDKSGIFDKEEFKNFHTKKFALPDIKDGVILEYTYEIKSSLIFQPRTWYFQSDYPTKWSEYRFMHSQYHIYTYNQEGYNPLTTHDKGADKQILMLRDRIEQDGTRKYGSILTPHVEGYSVTLEMVTNRWVMENIPALRTEPFITTPLDYYDKMEFQLNSIKPINGMSVSFGNTWDKFVKDEMKDGTIGKKLRQHGGIKDLAKTLTQDKTEPMDKIVAISNYIKSNISLQNGFFLASDRSNEDVVKKKTGTANDINLLLGAMLSEAGLKVTPVYLSTRSHGRVAQTYPLESRFNYLIMAVDINDKKMLLDAANGALPTGVLPFEALNGQGLLMDIDNWRWIDLQATKVVDVVSADVTVENGKILRGAISTTQKSYKGWDSRLKIAKDGEDKHAKAMLEKLVGNGKLTSQKFDNTSNSNEPLNGKFAFETSEFMDVNAERIYLNPMLSFGKTENLLKKADRQFPVDFAHPSEEIYNFSFKVPEGYVVEELPKPVKLVWDDGSIAFMYAVAPANAEGVVKITSKLSIKKPVFMASEYANLKKTFDDIVAKHAEQIVLKKAK